MVDGMVLYDMVSSFVIVYAMRERRQLDPKSSSVQLVVSRVSSL